MHAFGQRRAGSTERRVWVDSSVADDVENARVHVLLQLDELLIADEGRHSRLARHTQEVEAGFRPARLHALALLALGRHKLHPLIRKLDARLRQPRSHVARD